MRIKSRVSTQKGDQGGEPSRPRSGILEIFLIGVGYFLAGRLGLVVPYTDGNVSAIWPAAGLAYAVLLARGARVWPAIAAGAFFVNLFTPIPALAAAGIAIGNAIGPLAAATLARRAGAHSVATLRQLTLLLACALPGTAISASIGTGVLFLTDVRAWGDFLSAWLIWWLGDSMGVLLVAPLVLGAGQLRLQRRRMAELALLLAAITLVSAYLTIGTMAESVFGFVLLPLIIWASVRFGVVGAALVCCAVAAVVVWTTAVGLGPFVRQSTPLYNAAVLQAFICALTVSGLSVAVVVAERETVEQALLRDEALRQSEERFRQLADNVDAVFWMAEPAAQRLLYVSSAFEKIWGRSRTTIYENQPSLLETIHPDDRGLLMSAMEAQSRGESTVREYRVLRPDGSFRWIMDRAFPVQGHRSEITRVAGVAHDVTERKQAELALRESEERFRSMADSAPVMIWVADAGRQRTYVNRSWLQFTGLPLAEELGTTWSHHIHPEDAEQYLEITRSAFDGRASFTMEYRLRRNDGEYRWVIDQGHPRLSPDGTFLGFIGCVIDITERIQAERAMRNTEKLSAAGKLAASIAHEINNPLEAITNLIYLASRDPEATPDIKALLVQADQELRRVAQIAHQTLAFYRDSSAVTEIRLAELIQETAFVYMGKLAAKGLSVRHQIEDSATIIGFAGEIRQVLANLLLNAIDASPARGTITIRAKQSQAWKGDKRGVRVTIADEGAGIPLSIHNRIFEPFFTTKRDAGNGLGLWVCRGIVERHNGSIRFRSWTSADKSGTVFSLFFPAERATKRPPAADANAATS